MSEQNRMWFHCGRCGSLFESEMGEHDRKCGECGEDPYLGTEPERARHQGANALLKIAARSTADMPSAPARVGIRKRKKNFLMVKLILGWFAFMIALLIVGGLVWKKPERENDMHLNDRAVVGTQADEDVALIQRAYRGISTSLVSFLVSTTPEERGQVVMNPVALAGRMDRFYIENSVSSVDVNTLEHVRSNAVTIQKDKRFIESRWRNKEGQVIETSFFPVEGEWRLDWPAFVQYGDVPWALFLAGGGEAEGEFRLLARERLAEENRSTQALSLAFSLPVFGHPDQVVSEAPEVEVDRRSPDGLLLAAALDLREKGKRPFDAALPLLDPERTIRVRVRLRRIETPEGRKLQLVKVLACHWLSVDEAGVEPLARIPGMTAPARQSIPD